MKNNKFIIPLLLLGLVACGGGSTSNDNGSNPSSEPTSESTSIYSSEEEIIRNDVLIGIYNGKLTKNSMYTSLIGLDILEKKNLKENV